MPSAHRFSLSLICAGCLLPILSASPESTTTPPQTLVEWKVVHFMADELRNGTSDDGTVLGNDTNSNLIRYALGYGPRDPMPTLLTMEIAPKQFEVVTPQAVNRPDIACQLETSIDLRSWDTAVSDLSLAATTQRADSTDSSTTFPIDVARYFRLKVQRTIDDIDHDGLPDDHELAWFASIAHGPADDPDHDQVSTEEELLVGRSPSRGIVNDRALAEAATGLEVFTPLE